MTMSCSSTLRMYYGSFYCISATFILMEKFRVVHLKHYVYYHYITWYRSCQRDSIVKFFNNFHSYPPIETSSDYQDINTTYQYYVSTTVLTLFYQCSIAQQHMSSICCIITHHPASSPKEKEQGRK